MLFCRKNVNLCFCFPVTFCEYNISFAASMSAGSNNAYLLAYINIKHPGGGFNLDGKIKASQFVQKKGEEHVSSDLVAKPVMKLPTAEHFGLSEDKEKRLSEIIDEINSKTLSSLILMILMMHLLKDCHRIKISFQCCCQMMK